MVKIFCSAKGSGSGSDAAYLLLEHAYYTLFGRSLPEIVKTPNGKPYFKSEPDIHLSLSHATTHVLCALSNEPVGVDIETPRAISERAIQFFSSPDELTHFAPLDLWVLKESYIKLIGGTLVLVKSLRFSCENGQIITPDKLAFSKLYRIGNCRAAVSTYSAMLPDSIELV